MLEIDYNLWSEGNICSWKFFEDIGDKENY